MYICICNAVTENEIRVCAREGACTLGELECLLGVGAGCGRCKHAAHTVLNETRAGSAVALAAQAQGSR